MLFAVAIGCVELFVVAIFATIVKECLKRTMLTPGDKGLSVQDTRRSPLRGPSCSAAGTWVVWGACARPPKAFHYITRVLMMRGLGLQSLGHQAAIRLVSPFGLSSPV